MRDRPIERSVVHDRIREKAVAPSLGAAPPAPPSDARASQQSYGRKRVVTPARVVLVVLAAVGAGLVALSSYAQSPDYWAGYQKGKSLYDRGKSATSCGELDGASSDYVEGCQAGWAVLAKVLGAGVTGEKSIPVEIFESAKDVPIADATGPLGWPMDLSATATAVDQRLEVTWSVKELAPNAKVKGAECSISLGWGGGNYSSARPLKSLSFNGTAQVSISVGPDIVRLTKVAIECVPWWTEGG